MCVCECDLHRRQTGSVHVAIGANMNECAVSDLNKSLHTSYAAYIIYIRTCIQSVHGLPAYSTINHQVQYDNAFHAYSCSNVAAKK